MKVGIVGAGIAGKLFSLALCHFGFEVTIFDQGDGESCSMSAAGLLTPFAELEKNDLIIYELGIASLNQHWPKILSQLSDEIYFLKNGSILISHPRDRLELDRMMQCCNSRLPQSQMFCKKLTNHEIHNLEPDLDKFHEGYFFSNEGQIDNHTLLENLEKYLLDKITWHKNTFVCESKSKQIVVKDKIYYFDWVFDCRGLGAKVHFNDLRGIRGELIWLHAPHVMFSRPIRFLHPRYQLYIAPRPNHIYLLGSSEIESEDYSDISVHTTLELLTAAYYIQPKFAEARILKTITHCRPTLMEHLPKIKYCEGFIAVNGLYRHGFLIAPALVNDVMNFLQFGMSAVNYPKLWEQIK